MLKNGLALIGFITCCRYGYKAFNAIVEWKVNKEVAKAAQTHQFETPA